MDRSTLNIRMIVEHDGLRRLLHERLTAAGYAPVDTTYEEAMADAPQFGPREEAVFIVYPGPDSERLFTLAQHLYDHWSEIGLVLYFAFHPTEPGDQELFRLWKLDSLWGYNTPQSFIALNNAIDGDHKQAIHHVLRFLAYFLKDEQSEIAPGVPPSNG
jgi:hypothetical protein